MDDKMNIQWFPGHMAKARRMVLENKKMVDAVCEIIDARIPRSSRNPEIDDLVGDKPRLIILNRTDQADPQKTGLWAEYFRKRGAAVICTDSKSGKGTNAFQNAICQLLKEKIKYYNSRGLTGRMLRIMILGIPNVGKSSFINRIAKRKATETSDRPGVTRGQQWIKIGSGIEMLDTPGLLWPKFDDRQVGENLAFTGAIKDSIMDTETLCSHLLETLCAMYPEGIEKRYKISVDPGADGFTLLENIAKNRGFLISRGEYDTNRMANVILDEFRAGRLGRITLEMPEEQDESLGN